MEHKIERIFSERFGSPEGRIYASAGRINIIGEHTDYNEGFVFPGAIDRVIMAEIRPNNRGRARVYSIDMDEAVEFGLRECDAPSQDWARYIFGVCRELMKIGGRVEGFDAVFSGNVPFGAGLGSSAALESCFAFGLNDTFNDGKIPAVDLIKIGQNAEHHYCGVNCGIMDQYSSVLGKKDHLMRLDCRDLTCEYFPFAPSGHKLVLLDSGVKHALKDSPYNARRESCERVAKALGVPSLRDVSLAELNAAKATISDEDYRRAKYVIEEKQRVLDVCAALERGDYETVGRKMYETHQGLSRDYEVSCPELDFLVDTARELGVTGARVMGGGFGGCTINLVPDAIHDEFITQMAKRFNGRFHHLPAVYEVHIAEGAHRLK